MLFCLSAPNTAVYRVLKPRAWSDWIATALTLRGLGVSREALRARERELDSYQVAELTRSVDARRFPLSPEAVPVMDRPHRAGGAPERVLGELRCVGIARRVAGDGAKTEALRGVE